MQRPHRLDRVGLVGALVGAIALDAREAQREAAGILRALLQVVERDLDDELGPHVHGVAVAAAISRASSSCVCHSSSASVMPLKVLPSMTQPPRRRDRARRGAGWTASRCRRPWPHSAASTTRSSVCARLTLSQLAPRPPGLVRRVERLRHHAFVAARQRVGVEVLGGGDVGGDDARDHERRRQRGGERVEALVRRAVEQRRRRRRCRQSKKKTASGSSARMRSTSSLRPKRRIVTWNGSGAPSARERDRLAVEDQLVAPAAPAAPRRSRAPTRSRRSGCACRP